MRRRRSSRLLHLLAAAVFLLGASARVARSQEPAGALELIYPFGARAVGMGQAVVASGGASDAVWWNPAGLATVRRRELALQYLKRGEIVNVTALTYTLPRPPVGVFALSGFLADYGAEESLDEFGSILATFSQRFVSGVATFATNMGRVGDAGVNFRIFQRRFDCSGDCSRVPESSSLSSAVDAGIRLRPVDSLPVTFGLAVRHVGLRFQQKDEAQSDVIPTRYHIGLTYEPALKALPEAALRVSAEVVKSPNFGETGTRVGGEMGWQERFFVRTGYAHRAGASGGSVGLGFASDRLHIDLARSLGVENEILGGAPTLLTLRYQF